MICGMDIAGFVRAHGGIVHRQAILDAGASPTHLRAVLAAGHVDRVRRYWVADATAPVILRAAAEVTARVACVSAARHRGWWIPPDAPSDLHLHVHSRGQSPDGQAHVHWGTPIVPVSARDLVESVVDTLEHVATCLPREQALVIWESAIIAEGVPLAELQRVRWRSAAARELCGILTGLSDSGIETIFVSRIRPWGIPVRQQVRLIGHPVDTLIGERLVAQLDGFAFHSSSADRTRDLAHDRALIAAGFTVLRFSYTEVIYRWEVVEHAIARALAQGAHLAS